MTNRYAHLTKAGREAGLPPPQSRAEKETAEQRMSRIKQELRVAGFGEEFFIQANSWGLKIESASISSDSARITFYGFGVKANAKSKGQKAILSFEIPSADSPTHPDQWVAFFRRANQTIGQSNKLTRACRPDLGKGAKNLDA